MPAIYRIHPGLGVARLGNSPQAFCISPEQPAALPIDCDARGNPLLSPDGVTERTIGAFKDAEGRMKRQAARFHIFVYDDEHPQGRPVKLGDAIEGGGNAGTLIDIEWRVYLANKKSAWHTFEQLEGEHGYADDHPLRNAAITDAAARQRLIIDPGPRTVDHTTRRTAQFSREGGDDYATTFPPALEPNSIDTLGDLLTDDTGRLLVLGGHGSSGSYLYEQFGEPRIVDYANNDGWFDDTSDGTVMARLKMYSPLVKDERYVDVEYPAWVVCAYPAYVPEVLDVVTMDDVIEDMAVRKFAARTDLYGTAGTFDDPQRIAPTDAGALIHWRAGRVRWNPDYKPWFYRDIWRILYRPDQYSYLCDVLGQSNYPHNQSTRGTFDPEKLGIPPTVDRHAVAICDRQCLTDHHSGKLFVDELVAALAPAAPGAGRVEAAAQTPDPRAFARGREGELRKALQAYARKLVGEKPVEDLHEYLQRWRAAGDSVGEKAKEKLKQTIDRILHAEPSYPDSLARPFSLHVHEQLQKYHSGTLLRECRDRCVNANTHDPYGPMRGYLFDLLRPPGADNQFMVGRRPDSRVHNLPLMPLLCGDNPITNTLVSKFFQLTDYQYYLLRQWMLGRFHNEKKEGWSNPDPLRPYADWVNRSGRDLDRGVISNVLGGSFCPGGEIGWVMRNPSIWLEPYRIKADPAFYNFGQTGAQSNTGRIRDNAYAFYAGLDLSQKNDFVTGLQPGDLTKYMSVPWQADFNECSTQSVDVTYEKWNKIFPGSDNDERLDREQRVWETLWWPAHRPLQTFEVASPGASPTWLDWTPGVPQTDAGDLKMVTEWWRLSVVKRNPQGDDKPTTLPPGSPPPYISVERTKRTTKEDPS
jgi:hypothetical protein